MTNNRTALFAEAFRELGRSLRPTTDPRGQLKVRLCDDAWEPHPTLTLP